MQGRPAIRLSGGRGDERRVQGVHLAVEHLGEDLGDPLEMVSHRPERYLAGRGDVPHRGGEQVPVGDDGARGLDDERPPDLGRVPSLENRLEFPRRVIKAVRQAVGPGFVVGIRMSLDEDEPNGLGFDEALLALRSYIADGIDFASTIKGHIDSDASLARVIPSMGTPAAPFLDFSAAVKRAVDIPHLVRKVKAPSTTGPCSPGSRSPSPGPGTSSSASVTR